MPSRLERSFWGEKVCGFQTKKVGRRFQIVLFLYRKKDKTGFDFRKESEISLTGLSFWFQWESQPKEPKMQSRQRASPF